MSLPSHFFQAVNNDHALRYHDLRRNEYQRYFRGHTATVTSLCMSPKTDMFLSASQVSDKGEGSWGQ